MLASTEEQTVGAVPEERLERVIGPFALGANAVNLAVGAGVFALPAAVAALLGPAAVLAYLLCGLTITCVLLCCAELGSCTTRSGGVIAYAEEAFGPLAGFLAWALYAIGCNALSDAAIAHVLVDAVAAGIPQLRAGGPRIAVFAVLFGGFAAVNVRGVRYGSGLSVISTIAKLVPLMLLIVVGLPAIRWPELRWSGWPSYPALGEASLLVFFIFMSAEGALTASGEVRNPLRTVPRAMIGAAATLVVLYVSLQIVSQGVLGADLAHQGSTPLASLANRLLGSPGRSLLLACTAIAVFGSLSADMVNTPRAFLAAAEDGLLPRGLAAVHGRFHTPHVAIVVYAVLVFAFTISGAFRPLAVLATISQLLIYLVLCLGVLRMRRVRAAAPGAFRAPGGPAVPLVGMAAVLWLLSHSTRGEVAAVAMTLAIATVYYMLRARQVHRDLGKTFIVVIVAAAGSGVLLRAGAEPVRSTTGLVISASDIASRIGARVLEDGGNAVDAAVATAFALAVTHPTAGNIGGGGFLLYRGVTGDAEAYDFREAAPAAASPTMFLKDGKYDADVHHNGYLAVGVPGTVAGLHLAWKDKGRLPWKRLVDPAVALARNGFPVSDGLARSLAGVLPQMRKYPSSLAQFSKNGVPYAAGDRLKQPVLATTLQRIANEGPAGFYDGPIAAAFEREMLAHGGLISREDLRRYAAVRRTPLRGTYRDVDVIAVPPPTSGGVALIEMLNILEGYELSSLGAGSAAAVHLMAESAKRAFSDRAAWLGDPDFIQDMPLARLTSKPYAADLRKTISSERATKSSPTTFEWPRESEETTHLSVVDRDRNAVSMTYTIEQAYGVRIVLPGGGFLLNNEMGDFNAAPGLTTPDGLIGTPANLAQPGKRMLSSMAPTILLKDGRLFMVTGSPGGRTIINTVLQTIVNVVDFGMNAQEAVDAGRFHHQWLPDRIVYERLSFSPDTLALLRAKGHDLVEGGNQGVAEVIVHNPIGDTFEGGVDRRQPDGGAAVPR